MNEQADEKIAEWSLHKARIVGVFKTGGAYIEECERLVIQEGRLLNISGEIDDGSRSETLNYDFTFECASGSRDRMEFLWAAINVVGSDDEQRRLSIQGNGWLGFDDTGHPAGAFLKPPRIRVLVGEDEAGSLKASVKKVVRLVPGGS